MDNQFAIDQLKEILKIESVNPPGQEEKVALKLQALLESYGIETKLVPHSEGRANLIAYLRGKNKSDRSKVFAFSGHMDVVPPGEVVWDYPPFSATEVEGKIYARGACDMKSGLMASIMSMIALKEEGITLNGDIKLLASIGEEAGAVGAKQIVEEGHVDDVDAILITEPTGGEILTQHKGALWVKITCYGKTAHGSTPTKGINAILHIHEIMNQILSEEFPLNSGENPLEEPTYSIDVIQGGNSTNVVPDRCSINIDFRTVKLENKEEILDELHAAISRAKQKYPELKVKLDIINDLAPLHTKEDDPFVQSIQEVCLEAFGERKVPSSMTGYTDASQFMLVEKDVPIVIWSSIQGDTAHQPNEFVRIDEYLRDIELLKKIAIQYLNE